MDAKQRKNILEQESVDGLSNSVLDIISKSMSKSTESILFSTGYGPNIF